MPKGRHDWGTVFTIAVRAGADEVQDLVSWLSVRSVLVKLVVTAAIIVAWAFVWATIPGTSGDYEEGSAEEKHWKRVVLKDRLVASVCFLVLLMLVWSVPWTD